MKRVSKRVKDRERFVINQPQALLRCWGMWAERQRWREREGLRGREREIGREIGRELER